MSNEDDILIRAAIRDELTAPLRAMNKELAGVRAQMGRVGDAARSSSRSTDTAATAVRSKTAALDKMVKGLTSTDNAIGKLGKKMSGFVSGAGSAFLRWAKFAAAGLLTLGARSALKFAMSMEQAKNSFTNLLGSSTQADALIGKLKDFAKVTPFNFGELTQLAQQLLAVDVPVERLIPTMKALGDATAKVGGGADVLQRLVTNFGQIAAAQKVTSRDINDFTANRIPALRLMAEKLGITTDALKKMIETAGGGAKVFKQLGGAAGIADLIGAWSKGSMDAAMNTFQGRWSNFVDSFQQAMLPLASKVLGGLSTEVKTLGDWLSGPKGQAAVAQFTETLVALWPTVWAVAKALAQASLTVLRLAVALKPFAPLLVSVATGLTGLLVLYKVAQAVTFVRNAWALMNAAFAITPVGMIIIGLAAVAAGLIYAYKHSETFRNLVHGAMDAASTAIGWVIDKAKELWGWFGRVADRVKDLSKSRIIKFAIDYNPAVLASKGIAKVAKVATGDRSVPVHTGRRQGFDRRHLANSLSLYSAAASMTPGRQVLTSTVRGHGVGQNSQHLTGRAFDVAGQNLPAFARNVESLGGRAEFHGEGQARHVHAVGDRSVPATVRSASSSRAPIAVTIRQTFTQNQSRDDAAEIARAVRDALADVQLEFAERA